MSLIETAFDANKEHGGLCDDLAKLTRLDEQILLEQLKRRYNEDKIYTYIGDILVAVNPFKQLPIYGRDQTIKYDNGIKGEHPPHVFATADWCYHGMINSKKNYCVVVSGESGAGKTESAKFIIRHIIHLCQGGTASALASDSLEQRILQVNPLLEAFGNAQTIMNDNSSRFGKYTELVFNHDGAVLGARISEYLLEKSRVVNQLETEQNFHIFYYLFHHPQASSFALNAPETYEYLSNIGGVDCNEKEMFDEVLLALSDVGFTEEEQMQVCTLLAAILHIGNINFHSVGHSDDAQVDDDSAETLETVAHLLDVDQKELRSVLQTQINITRGEIIKKNHDVAAAYDVRDAWAKAIYGRMFGWLIVCINKLLKPSSSRADEITVGILDIFGFENFQANSFEQWCINLANEQLQHFFNQHIFELELEEYTKEGIDTINITYVDNEPLLNLHLKPMGLFALLDEESMFPNSTDNSLVAKFHKIHEDNTYIIAPRSNEAVFTIKHYAGDVKYQGEGFIYKNRDNLVPGVFDVMQGSSMPLLSTLFYASITAEGRLDTSPHGLMQSPTKGANPHGARRGSSTPNGKLSRRAVRASIRRGEIVNVRDVENTTSRRAPTVGRQFTTSLQHLVDRMNECTPMFVRCIKPNTGKSPNNFQDDFVMVQLSYTGMLETTRIRREGYSVRPTYEDFVRRYHLLAFRVTSQLSYDLPSCEAILEAAKVEGALMGHTKVFLRYFHVDLLDKVLIQHHAMAIALQKISRGFAARRRHHDLLRRAQEQKEAAEAMLTRLSTMTARIDTSVKAMCEYDAKMQHDLALRAEQARRAEETRKKREQEEQERREKEEREREAALVAEALEKAQAEHDALQEKLAAMISEKAKSEEKQQEQDALIQQLEDTLQKQKTELSAKLREYERSVATLKQDLREKESDLNSQLTDREHLIKELTRNVEHNDTLKSQVNDQQKELVENRSKVRNLMDKLDSQEALLSKTRSAYDTTVKQLNDVVLQKEKVAGETKVALEDAMEKMALLQDEMDQQQAVSAELEDTLNGRERALQEKDRECVDLKKQLRDAEERCEELDSQVKRYKRKADDLMEELEEQRRTLSTTKGETSSTIRELNQALSSKQEAITRLEAQVESASSEQRTTQSKLTAVQEQLGEAKISLETLEEKLSSSEKARAKQASEHADAVGEKDRTIAALRRELESLKASSDKAQHSLENATESATTMEKQLKEREAYLAKVEADLAAHQQMLHTEQARNTEERLTMKRQLEEKEAQILELTHKVERNASTEAMSKADTDARLEQLQKTVADRTRTVAELRTELETQQHDNAVAVRQLQEKHHRAAVEATETISGLELQLQQKEAAVKRLAAERDEATASLSEKMSNTEAEVAGELRSKLRSINVELEEKEADLKRMESKMRAQEKLYEVSKEDNEKMVEQLRQMLAGKDKMLRSMNEDHEDTVAELEGKLRNAKKDADRRVVEIEDELAQLRMQLRKKETELAHEKSEREHINATAEGRAKVLDAELASVRTKVTDLQGQLASEREEIVRLQSKLDSQHELHMSTKAAYDEAAVQVESAKEAAANKIRDLSASHEARVSELKADLREKEKEAKRRASDLERQLETAKIEHSSTQEQLKLELSRREQEVSRLESNLFKKDAEIKETVARVGNLQARERQLESKVTELTSKIQFLSDDLHAANQERETLSTEKQRTQLEAMERMGEMEAKLKEQEALAKVSQKRILDAIRTYGRKQGSSKNRSDVDVDLERYMFHYNKKQAFPLGLDITRFKCKSEISKLGGTHWDHRYLVFDLQKAAVLVYEDSRELRTNIKTRIPMSDIMAALIPKNKMMQASHEFIVRSTKREYHFRASSADQRNLWVHVINTVSPSSSGSPRTIRRGSAARRTSFRRSVTRT